MKIKKEDPRPLPIQVADAIVRCLIPASEYVGCSGRMKVVRTSPEEGVRISAQIRRCERKAARTGA